MDKTSSATRIQKEVYTTLGERFGLGAQMACSVPRYVGAAYKTLNRHNIMREFRMVGRPHYGGHVERLPGTFAQDIHTLPGTTFSNVTQRGEYDSEKHAAMTVDAFEL